MGLPLTVSLDIPDLPNIPDVEVAALARGHDGRWSEQTKRLLTASGTSLLDLNSNWASTWIGWACPCCRREKPQICRLSEGNVLLCRLELHHDHIERRRIP